MDSPGGRYKSYYRYNMNPRKYDYEHRGLLDKIMSKTIIRHAESSPALEFVLNVFENSLIFIYKYADKVNNFKNITKYNR